MVGALLASLGCLILLVVAHIAAVWLRVLDLVRIVSSLCETGSCDSIPTLTGLLVRVIGSRSSLIGLVVGLGIGAICALDLCLFLLGV